MNSPVNFEIAKLLKEKGFDKECRLCIEDGDERPLPFNCGNTLHRNDLHPYYSAPTIAEVVMWLYEKYGIWISVEEYKDHASDVNDEPTFISNIKRKEYSSPTEAYEAAIEYTLNNLL